MKENKYEGFEEYNLDDIICTCAYISRREILDVLNRYDIKDVDEITELNGAGGGCGFCREDLEEIMIEFNKKKNKQ
jgi:bacterioferritin-associated ferredoxin